MSIEQTRKKYHGRKAETYDEIRTKQGRWKLENEAVERMLKAVDPTTVLDCPVGTGRFLPFYRKEGWWVTGIDISAEMIDIAAKKSRKRPGQHLIVGDILDMGIKEPKYGAAVCVRFLDLIEEDAMQKVVTALCRAAHRAVILTIRLGDTYVPKSNTAEHDRKKFNALVKKLGWKIEESVAIFDAGWTVMRLGRK